MAQLPPKIPNIMLPNHLHSHNSLHHQWPEFKNEHEHEHHSNPSWVDEFMEFSAAKRGAHRRTMSDSSVTFLDAGGPAVPTAFNDVMLSKSSGADQRHHDVVEEEQFEKFDDEQFMSMFSNELGSCSNPSSTSDHNSTNDDQKGAGAAVEERAGGGGCGGSGGGGSGGGEGRERAEEVVESSSCKQQGVKLEGENSEAKVGTNSNNTDGSNGNNQLLADPKRVKRILANRQSAQRSRVRKLQYISELERSVTALQSEVSVLSPRVAFLDHQRMLLNLDNSALKSKLAALAQDKIFKDAHQEALKREIERLRQVYYQQNLKRNDGSMTPQSSSPLPSPGVQPPCPDIRDNDNEQPTA